MKKNVIMLFVFNWWVLLSFIISLMIGNVYSFIGPNWSLFLSHKLTAHFIVHPSRLLSTTAENSVENITPSQENLGRDIWFQREVRVIPKELKSKQGGLASAMVIPTSYLTSSTPNQPLPANYRETADDNNSPFREGLATGGIGRELIQIGMGVAYMNVVEEGWQVSLGSSNPSSFVVVPISAGKLVMGPGQDLLASGPENGQPSINYLPECRLLVTLQGTSLEPNGLSGGMSEENLIHLECPPANEQPQAEPGGRGPLGLISGQEDQLGFKKPGARHVVNNFRAPDEFSDMRDKALRLALEQVGIDPKRIFEKEFEGTPVARTFRTFVCPRQKKIAKLALEPIEKAAERTANQIAFLLRHHEATKAEYMRNTDLILTPEQKEKLLPSHPLVIILDNLRSAYNVGSIFRTAETAGIEEVITCGITAGAMNPKVLKTAFKASENVKSSHFSSTKDAILTMKDRGYSIYAMETTSKSKVYTEIQFPRKSAFIMGNEVTGVDLQLFDLCDEIIEIPMFGQKNSLNVASACPVVLFEAIRQWNIPKKD